MVLIRKATVQQKRRVKRRNENSFFSKALEHMKSLIGMIITVVIVSGTSVKILDLVLGENDANNDHHAQQQQQQVRNGKNSNDAIAKSNIISNSQNIIHLNNFESSLEASYEAIAIDILDTLDCIKVLNQTAAGLGGGNAEWRRNIRGRRRLTTADDDNDDPAAIRRPAQREIPQFDINEMENEWQDNNKNDMQEEGESGNNNNNNNADVDNPDKWNNPMMDDIVMENAKGGDFWDAGGDDYMDVSGKDLFCIAAVSAMTNLSPTMQSTVQKWKNEIKCDATSSKQEQLFNLWSAARAEIPDKELLLKSLSLAKEARYKLWNHTVFLWSPESDGGLDYILGELNNEKSVDFGGIHGLHNNLGRDHVFVDVGSALGTTTLAVSLLYPGTKIVSIEPAAPNWLMQEMNLRCNLLPPNDEQYPTVLLSGVGPSNYHGGGGAAGPGMMAKFLWKPSSVTATRAWTPSEEKTYGDIELTVKLRSFKSLLAEADIFEDSKHHIDVLNVDCEGCEYNLIPALSDDEYTNIDTVMGACHWGYIPTNKLPSSKRGEMTHKRLCQHENIARISKECCAFPNMAVKSSTPGEMLIKDDDKNESNNNIDGGSGPNSKQQLSTVLDVIENDLCNDFEQWSKEKQLFDIENDYGWFQISSTA